MKPVILDGGDRRCVLLLLELRKLIATLPPGAVVHLIATDPAAPLDLPAWCHLTGHDYLGEIRKHTYVVRVTDSAVETEESSPWRPARAHRDAVAASAEEKASSHLRGEGSPGGSG